MLHASEQDLQLLLDGELDADTAAAVRRHLAGCAECLGRYGSMERLSSLVHGSMPDLAGAASEGAFWSALTAEMEERQQEPSWPWLPFLPPALLALVGALVQVLAVLVLALWGAYQFGMPVALDEWLSKALAWLAGGTLSGLVYQFWGGVSPVTQSLLVAGMVLLGSTVALSATAVLIVSWALCWREPARRNGYGGR